MPFADRLAVGRNRRALLLRRQAWRDARRGPAFERVLEMARSDGGVCGVRLYVERENERAMATYKALGMTRAQYEMFEVDFVLG